MSELFGPDDIQSLDSKPEALDIPWPKNGHIYEAIIAVDYHGRGMFVVGNPLVKEWCDHVSTDMEDMTGEDLRPYAPGVYRARIKYWSDTTPASWVSEGDFEDGFELLEMSKIYIAETA